MFCKACTSLVLAVRGRAKERSALNDELTGTFGHHASYNDFNEALLIGCRICKKVREDGSFHDLDDTQKAAFKLTCDWSVPRGPGVRKSVEIIFRSVAGDRTTIWDLVPVEPSEDRLLLADYHETTNTGSAACFAVANHWLKTCLSKHQNCERLRPSSLKNWRPSRLIYIDNENSSLRLCEIEDIPIGVKYATLSHCWGQISERLVLTKDNIRLWRRKIPALGRMDTFRHAISISKQLGLHYIWIDSLCIIQDSQDDWSQQASLMSSVYQYSQCTITATAAVNDTLGCFFDRDLDISLPTRFEIVQDQVCSSGTIKPPIVESNLKLEDSGVLQGPYDFHKHQTWIFSVRQAAANQRSWIVQERLLSPRVLHFADKQLFWECTELQASESYPFGMPDEPYAGLRFKAENPFRYQNKYPIDDDLETASQKRDRLISGFRVWAHAVQAYTAGSLTNSEDKLIAISAIAREVQPLIRSRYLAGHWEADLVLQLAWSGTNFSSRPSMYRAPSWSWASIDGPIQKFHNMYANIDDYYPLIEILEAVTDLVSEDEMGQVQGGHLKLLGQTIDLEIMYSERGRYGPGKQSILINGQATKLWLLEDDEAERIPKPTSEFCCLLLEIYLGKHLYFHGLVLGVIDEANHVYRRVGLLSPQLGTELSEEDFLKDPLLSVAGKIEQKHDGTRVYKRETSSMREIVIV